MRTLAVCFLIMALFGCATTANNKLPSWALVLRADVTLLLSDMQAGATAVKIQEDVARIKADIDNVIPMAKEIKAAVDVFIEDLDTHAPFEKTISDGLVLLTAIGKLRG